MFKTPKVKVDRVSYQKSYKPFYEFDLTPEQLENYLDEYIIGQKEAKAIIATKICTHFHKVKNFLLREGRDEVVGFIKNNIFIIGPTGVGKTYMIKLIAKKIGVPFVKGDATKFSETGYVGGDVEDLIRDLYWEADGDLERARFGIVYLDEIDKIASSGDIIGPDVSRTGVQRALLKPLEETDVEIKVPPDALNFLEIQDPQGRGKRKKIVLNTKYIIFVVSGAFHGLEEIIKKRLNKQKLGFLSDIEGRKDVKFNYMKLVTPEDLVVYGFEREFVGRFPVIAVFEALTEDELFRILANPNSSIMINKKRDFKVYNIDIAFTNEALREIAKLALEEGTGARALARILEKVLIPFERTLPSLPINYLGVTSEIVNNPYQVLNSMINNPQDPKWKEFYYRALKDEEERVKEYLYSRQKVLIKDVSFEITSERLKFIFELYKKEDIELSQALEEIISLWKQIKTYEQSFERRNQIKILFTEDAIDTILEEVIKTDFGVFAYCEKIMSRFEYTLNIIKESTGKNLFFIPGWALKNPEKFLNQLLAL